MDSKLLRKLPKVDELLNHERIKAAAAGLSHAQQIDALREVIEEKRQSILAGSAGEAEVDGERIVDEAVCVSPPADR